MNRPLKPMPDLDGDGIGELYATSRQHQFGTAAWVYSGASGEQLFSFEVPGVPVFYGPSMAVLDDHNDDGISDFAVIGQPSGGASPSLRGLLDIRSGADGTLLTRFEPVPGTTFAQLLGTIGVPDIDGDGKRDLLSPIFHTVGDGQPDLQAFSSATGQALYQGLGPEFERRSTRAILIEDRDGDGVEDIALVLPAGSTLRDASYPIDPDGTDHRRPLGTRDRFPDAQR